ncbi:MAG: 50S ribosomal protein L9 [Candidatus Caldatribacteriota bacterium]
MKVILKQEIKKLGKLGQVVEVNDGFARNFLIPQGKAVIFTSGNLKQMEYLKKKEQDKKEKELKEAQDLAGKLAQIFLEIKVKAGEKDRLFGSVTAKDIAELLTSQYGLEIDRKKINLEEPLKKLGIYEISINLYKGVIGKIKINLVSEDESELEKEK